MFSFVFFLFYYYCNKSKNRTNLDLIWILKGVIVQWYAEQGLAGSRKSPCISKLMTLQQAYTNVSTLLEFSTKPYSVFHKSIAPSKELCSKMALGKACHSHDNATPLSFCLQNTEDFF